MEIELGYSDLEIGTSSMLFVESKYSKLMGEKTGGIVTDCTGVVGSNFFSIASWSLEGLKCCAPVDIIGTLGYCRALFSGIMNQKATIPTWRTW